MFGHVRDLSLKLRQGFDLAGRIIADGIKDKITLFLKIKQVFFVRKIFCFAFSDYFALGKTVQFGYKLTTTGDSKYQLYVFYLI